MPMTTKNAQQMPPVSQTESEALTQWTTKVIFKLCMVNLCRLSQKSDLYWETLRSASRDTSLAYILACHWHSNPSGLQNELRLPPWDSHEISHMTWKLLFLLKHEQKSFTALASKPLTLFSISFISYIVCGLFQPCYRLWQKTYKFARM
jgi:hypothetical protein